MPTLCSLILEFIHIFPVCFLLVLLFFIDYRKGARASFVLLFTLSLNPFLKSIWQVPLVQGGGWAFPSGHMQAACVFYGWVAWEFRFISGIGVLLFTLCLLAAIGGSLVYCGFHVWVDVVGGAFFGGLTLVLYQRVLGCSFVKKHASWMGIMMLPFTLCFIAFYPRQTATAVWIYQGLLVLLSVLLIWLPPFFKSLREKGYRF